MYTYAIALRPVVVAGGIEALDENKKKMFEGMLLFMSKFIESAEEVEEVIVTEDFNLIVKSNAEVYQTLKKLGKNAIVTQIETTDDTNKPRSN